MSNNATIAVVGAGIVGCSCALWLQRKGFSVILVDPEEPGSGTSSGNACTIADYGCVPVNSPSLFKRLPSLLTSRESPLTLDLTGGAPELNPHFKRLVFAARELGIARSSLHYRLKKFGIT